MSIIKVLLPLPNVPLLSYESQFEVAIADLVLVPFRKAQIVGIVWQIDPGDKYDGILKQVSQKLPYNISSKLIEFIQKAKNYYLTDLASVAKMVLPVDLNNQYQASVQNIGQIFNLSMLDEHQKQALIQIQQSKIPSVLHGVTGSGKTEVYFHLIAEVIKKGQQVLLILPEIALSQQIIMRFKNKFNFDSAIWHSSVTKVNKAKTLKGIIQGSVKVVIGARSSLFLPYKDLGLIIVDEEHDNSYKQTSGIYYNARDMAVMRAHLFNFKILLVSATPSIETYQNAKLGKYNLVPLKVRYNQAQMPEIEIIDMKKQVLEKQNWISKTMQDNVLLSLESGQQVLLFLNRTGYAPLMICSSCGFKICCLHCSTTLVWHKARSRLECHYCGFFALVFKQCPKCKTPDPFIPCGPGIERLEEEVIRLFNNWRIMLISANEMSSVKHINAILQKIINQEVDIIIGTQIITKGYHFPKLNFVGIIDADLGLSNCDLKSFESTFQLLQQVSGRAGRQTSGKVMLQTYQHKNNIIECIKNHDYITFIEQELLNRFKANMPPFGKLAIIIITAANQAKASDIAKKIKKFAPICDGIKVMGPAPAIINKLKGRYRYNILVSANKKVSIQAYLTKWLEGIDLPKYATVKIDIDPYSLM